MQKIDVEDYKDLTSKETDFIFDIMADAKRENEIEKEFEDFFTLD